MKILTTLSMVATVAAGLGAMTGMASAQAVAQAEPSQATAAATAPAPATTAGETTAVPDQVQSPAPAATVVAATVTNGPVPDTAANRAKYGGPMSHAGKKTQPAGN
ncbi:MAG TPA: hypothetical protein VKQ54_00775 [Caulobacteraceae bacterium]|nr:hypothetical protein [Caulobacteraceae bacterium]